MISYNIAPLTGAPDGDGEGENGIGGDGGDGTTHADQEQIWVCAATTMRRFNVKPKWPGPPPTTPRSCVLHLCWANFIMVQNSEESFSS